MTTTETTARLTTGEAEAFCERWATAWNDHDGDAVAALCAADLVYDEPALGDTAYGPDSIRGFVAAMAQAFPDYSFERIDGLIHAYRCLYDQKNISRQLGREPLSA